MKIEWKTCLKIGVTALAIYLCISWLPTVTGVVTALISAAAPLFVGACIAYLVNILMVRYEKWYFPKTQKAVLIKSRRPVCMVAAMMTLVAIVAAVIFLIAPQLISCIRLIIAEFPAFMQSFVSWLKNFENIPSSIVTTLSGIDWQSKIGQIISVLSSGVGSVMDVLISTVSSVFSGIVTALIGTIFSIYLLMGKDRLRAQSKLILKKALKPEWYKKLMYILSVLNDCFRKYIVGQCTEAVILGVLCTLGMLILRLPYAAMIGALIAFTALIPVAGAYIGAIVGAFMILTVSPVKALVFLIFLIVLQQLEGNIIYPRVVGSEVGLPGIWVLAAVTVGGGVLGVAGMLIAVPLTAAAYRLIKETIK